MNSNPRNENLESLQKTLNELHSHLVLLRRERLKNSLDVSYEASLTNDLKDTLVDVADINDANQLKFFYQLAREGMQDIRDLVRKYDDNSQQTVKINELIDTSLKQLRELSQRPKHRSPSPLQKSRSTLLKKQPSAMMEPATKETSKKKL